MKLIVINVNFEKNKDEFQINFLHDEPLKRFKKLSFLRLVNVNFSFVEVQLTSFTLPVIKNSSLSF